MKSMTKINLLIAVTIMCFVSVTYAAPVIYDYNGRIDFGFTPAWAVAPSGNDLLQTNLGSMVTQGNFNPWGWNPQGAGDFIDGDVVWVPAVWSNNSVVEFYLDTTVNTLGYNITNINTYAAWSDTGRDAQQYTISYSVVGSADWVSYDSVTHNETNPGGDGIISLVTWSMNWTGVDAVKFVAPDNVENNGVGLGEIDVIGTAVPEPATMMLLGLGALAVLKKKK
jgi:hypothetical protein